MSLLVLVLKQFIKISLLKKVNEKYKTKGKILIKNIEQSTNFYIVRVFKLYLMCVLMCCAF